jgi:hypothetical protein
VAINSNFNTGKFSTFVGIRDGAHVVSSGSGTGAFIQLDNSPVIASGNFFAASQVTVDSNNLPITGSQAPIVVTLARPLLSAVLSDISAIFGLVSIGDNATFTSSTPLPLIQVTGLNTEATTNVTVGGTHPITGQQVSNARLFTLFERNGFTPNVMLAGPFFTSNFATIAATGDVFGIFRAPFQSSTTQALLQIANTTVQGGAAFFNANGFVAGAPSIPTSVTFGGPLLTASFSNIDTVGNFLNFTFGADVGGGVGNAFVDLQQSSSIRTTAGAGGPGHFLLLCCGTPAARLTFQGSLLASVNSNLTLSGSLADISNGAVLRTTTPTVGEYPLVSLSGGSLTIAGAPDVPRHVFSLSGRPGITETDPETNPVFTNQASGLVFGTDQPLRHSGRGALLEMSNGESDLVVASVSGSILKLADAQLKPVDGQLLAATIPAVANLIGAELTTGSHAIDLGPNAKLELVDVIRLMNSTLTVNGNLLNVIGRVNIAGDVLRLEGTNTVIINGLLINLANGGIANIGRSLVNFVSGNSTVNANNRIAPTNLISGIPISVASGAPFNFSITDTPFLGLNQSNVININGKPLLPGATLSSFDGSLIAVGPGGGTLKIGTNGTPGTIVGTIAVPPPGPTPINGTPPTGALAK